LTAHKSQNTKRGVERLKAMALAGIVRHC
jgi:hypothetical protein